MNKLNMNKLKLVCSAVLLFSASSAVANVVGANYTVSTVPVGVCRTTTTNLAFGRYTGLNSFFSNAIGYYSAQSSSTVSVTCTIGTAYTVVITGSNDSGAQRRVMSTNAMYLNYNLYRDSSYTLPWGTVSKSGTGSTVSETVYGVMPSGQPILSGGSWNDLATVTVTYTP